MEGDVSVIYWVKFIQNQDTYILAKSEQGVCYFGNDFLQSEDFLQWAKSKGLADLVEDRAKLEDEMEQITAYFNGELEQFELALDLRGTPFQQQVWQALQTIPYGKTVSYSDVAEKIGRKKAVRAVANAIGNNPVLIIVPCHRIIGKNGKLTGFRGGLPLKEKLLALEGVILT